MRSIVIMVAILLCGCVERGALSLTDKSVVQTPVYNANKTMFVQPITDGAGKITDTRYGKLLNGYEIAEQVRAAGSANGVRRSIQNRQPISIVISRAFVPASLKRCNGRASDFLFGDKGRDIAVLLDVSTNAGTENFIAVWYQTGVPPGSLLTFGDLLVFSTDSWDAKYPPYFRVRLVDVTAERNTAVGAMLDRLNTTSNTLAGLANVANAGPLINLAGLAARMTLANEKNKAIVDFTFQLYGDQALSEAGGVPLGVLQTGGMLVTAPPCDANVRYWEKSLRFDHRLDRVFEDGAAGELQDVPYVFATILGADLAVPQIVRDRSTAIMQRLTDPQVAQRDIDGAAGDASALADTLGMLTLWEQFRRQPSAAAFERTVTQIGGLWGKLDRGVQSWALNSFYQVTGTPLTSPDEFKNWITRCKAHVKFNIAAGRYEVDRAIVDAQSVKCWDDL